MFIVLAKYMYEHHLADVIIQGNSRGFRMFMYSFLFNSMWIITRTL